MLQESYLRTSGSQCENWFFVSVHYTFRKLSKRYLKIPIMSDSLLFFSLLSLPVILGGVVLFFGFRKRKRLTWGKARFFLSKMDAIGKKTAAERIVGYDKILDHVLADL